MTSLSQLLLLNRALVMGILNVTPDSFSDGGEYFSLEKAVKRAAEMQNQGADIIDIGGESTRPGSEGISVDEECKRVLPVIHEIRKTLGKDIIISIDTYKAEVARQALEAGANIINSLGGFTFDLKLAEITAKYNCPLIIYHIKGKPKEMQKGDIIYTDVVSEITDFFKQQIKYAKSCGVEEKQLLLDPGIGFGKTMTQNLEIIKRFDEFTSLGVPLVFGTSRKSHIGVLLKKKLGLKETPVALERLEGSLAETGIAVLRGAKIIRTHDVLETKKFLAVLEEVL